jgi:alpha-L-fucosidase
MILVSETRYVVCSPEIQRTGNAAACFAFANVVAQPGQQFCAYAFATIFKVYKNCNGELIRFARWTASYLNGHRRDVLAVFFVQFDSVHFWKP